jgi:hypothetical protein
MISTFLSGHNRVEASRRLEMIEIPTIIYSDLSDDEAVLIEPRVTLSKGRLRT